MPQLTLADGQRVGYGDGGRDWLPGRALAVLVHGAGGDRSSWALQARALAREGWNVLAVDLPGHGASDRLEGEVSIDRLADWLGAAISTVDERHRERVAVAGHSMGACIAVTLAARDDRIDRLALLGAGAAMPVNDALLDDTLHHHRRAARFIAAFGHAAGRRFGGSELPGVWLLGATRAQVLRTAPEVLHADFAACNAWRSAELLPRVTCPTLVLIGGQDRMTPPAAGAALTGGLARVRTESLDDVGHMMMAEAPGAVTEALRRHFESTDGADAGDREA